MGIFSSLTSKVKSSSFATSVTKTVSSKYSSVKNSVVEAGKGRFSELTSIGTNLYEGKFSESKNSLMALGGSLTEYATKAKGLYDKGSGILGKAKSLFGFGSDKKSGKGKGGKGGKDGDDENGKNGKDSKTYVFSVEIDEIECASFEDCSGLSVHTDVIEIAEGGENTTTRKFYGNTHYDNIKLSNGVTSSDNALLNWLQETTSSEQIKKRSASLIMKSLAGKEIKRWNIFGAMPVKWDLPTNNKEKAGKNSAVIIENIEFAIDRFELES